MADEKDVLIVGEAAEGKLASITAELAAAATDLAENLGGEVVAALCGEAVGDAGKQAIATGASRVLVVESPLLQDFQVTAHVAALEQVAKAVNPAVVLMGKTSLGRDVAPRLAFRLGTGLVQDCIAVRIDPQTRTLEGDRPVYGGASVARVAVRSTPGVATLRPKAFDPLEPDPTRQGEVKPFSVELGPQVAMVKLLDRVKAEAEGIRLEDAKVVIGGGRGLGGPEPFQHLEELARLLGGAVGASRAVCDAGWLPHSYQIGLTGKTITADLYITVAISGASQHLAGISGVKNVVGINKDQEANVFKQARFGVVGDWQKVLPTFIETVHELVGP